MSLITDTIASSIETSRVIEEKGVLDSLFVRVLIGARLASIGSHFLVRSEEKALTVPLTDLIIQ